MKLNPELLKGIKISDLPEEHLLSLEQSLAELELGELPGMDRDLSFFAEVLLAKEMWNSKRAKNALKQIETIVISAQTAVLPADVVFVRRRESAIAKKHGELSRRVKSHLDKMHGHMHEGLMQLKENRREHKNEDALKQEQKMRLDVWNYLRHFDKEYAIQDLKPGTETFLLKRFGFFDQDDGTRSFLTGDDEVKKILLELGYSELKPTSYGANLKHKKESRHVDNGDLKACWVLLKENYSKSHASKMTAEQLKEVHGNLGKLEKYRKIERNSTLEFRMAPGRLIRWLVGSIENTDSFAKIASEADRNNLRPLIRYGKKYQSSFNDLIGAVKKTGELSYLAEAVSKKEGAQFFKLMEEDRNFVVREEFFATLAKTKRPDLLFGAGMGKMLERVAEKGGESSFPAICAQKFLEAMRETGEPDFVASLLERRPEFDKEGAPVAYRYPSTSDNYNDDKPWKNYYNLIYWSAKRKETPLFDNERLVKLLYSSEFKSCASSYWDAIAKTGRVDELTSGAFLDRLDEYLRLDRGRVGGDITWKYLEAIARTRDYDNLTKEGVDGFLRGLGHLASRYLNTIRMSQDAKITTSERFMDILGQIRENAGDTAATHYLDGIMGKEDLAALTKPELVEFLAAEHEKGSIAESMRNLILMRLDESRQGAFVAEIVTSREYKEFFLRAFEESAVLAEDHLKALEATKDLKTLLGKKMQEAVMHRPYAGAYLRFVKENCVSIKKNIPDGKLTPAQVLEFAESLPVEIIYNAKHNDLFDVLGRYINKEGFWHLDLYREKQSDYVARLKDAIGKINKYGNWNSDYGGALVCLENFILSKEFSLDPKERHLEIFAETLKKIHGAKTFDSVRSAGAAFSALLSKSSHKGVETTAYFGNLVEKIEEGCQGNDRAERLAYDALEKSFSSRNGLPDGYPLEKLADDVTGYAKRIAQATESQKEYDLKTADGKLLYFDYLFRSTGNRTRSDPILPALNAETAENLLHLQKLCLAKPAYEKMVLEGLQAVANSTNFKTEWVSKQGMETVFSAFSWGGEQEAAVLKSITGTESFDISQFSEENLARLKKVIAWASKSINEAQGVPEHGFYFEHNFSPSCVAKNPKLSEAVVADGLKPAIALALMESVPGIPDESVHKLAKLFPPGGRVSKDKYSQAVFLTFLKEKPKLQQRVVNYFLAGEPKANDDVRLLSVMSFANSIGEDFVRKLESEKFASSAKLLSRCKDYAIDLLSSKYSRELLAAFPTEKLEKWLTVIPEFEQTMKIHDKEKLIPPLRLLATIELLGKERGFALHDKELEKALFGQAETLFPDENERKKVLEYLEKWHSMEDEKKIFAGRSEEEILRQLTAWRQPTKLEHTLAEISVVDRLEEVQSKLDDVFYKNHFCNEFLKVAGLEEGAPTIEALSARYRQLKAEGTAEAELAQVRQEQDGMRKWSRLQSIFKNYGERMEGLKEEIREAGKGLAPYEGKLAEWGFDYGDSFGNKVFLGELKLLENRVKRELVKSPTDQALLAIAGEIAKISKACDNANSYVLDVAERLSPSSKKSGILDDLKAKQKWAEETKQSLDSGNMPFAEAVEKIRKEEPSFFVTIEQELGRNEKKEEFLSQALFRYTDITAINDLEAIVSITRNENREKNQVLVYATPPSFSAMELAMVGQCLDYRCSKNSIDNAPSTVSYRDSSRQMVVAYPLDDNGFESPQVNGLMFIAKTSEGEGEQPAIVLDRIYATGARDLGWSKIEGHVRFALEKAKETGLPLVVPDHLSSYFVQVKEWAAAEGFAVREVEKIGVTVQPGPAGETYCELAGYNRYDKDTQLDVKALVLERKA